MCLFNKVGMTINGIRYLSPKEAHALSSEEVVFVDTRPEYETSGKRILVNALVYLPRKTFAENFQILDPEKHYIVFDQVGLYSKETLIFLAEKGFPRVAGMIGGIADWERDGLPMIIDQGELMTGSCMCTLKPRKKFGH